VARVPDCGESTRFESHRGRLCYRDCHCDIQSWTRAAHLYCSASMNSALHPSGVARWSTSFGWGKGGNVASAGWQVTLCDSIWHVNCYISILYFAFSSMQQASPLRELTCHMGSHSVTCHQTQVTFPPLPQPDYTGTRFSDPRQMQS